jgi:hypothetical protein
MKRRVAIVTDGDGAWFVRRIRVVEHDGDKDEKVYRCDQPIGKNFPDLDSAAAAAKQYLAAPGE